MKFFLALMLMAVVPSVNAQVAHVGDILCTSGVYVSPAEYENSGLEAMGVIFYVDATGQHGWAVALEDEGSFMWGDYNSYYGYDSPLSDYSSQRSAIYDLDGLFNTQEVLGDENGSYPAFEVVDVVNGWYLPTIGQLNYLYGNLVEVNTGLIVVNGSIFKMTDSWDYWSSTECTPTTAWHMNSSGNIITGNPNSGNKRELHSVRCVRNF